jgi:hypothetical protein
MGNQPPRPDKCLPAQNTELTKQRQNTITLCTRALVQELFDLLARNL